MRTEARFIKPDDFFNYTGMNLYEKLKLKDNESNKADLFLMYVEDTMLDRVDATSFRICDYDHLTPYQKEQLQRALIYQSQYIIRSGDLFTDSGYDVDKGLIADYNKIQQIALCRPAIDALINAGLYNHKIRNRIRYWSI